MTVRSCDCQLEAWIIWSGRILCENFWLRKVFPTKSEKLRSNESNSNQTSQRRFLLLLLEMTEIKQANTNNIRVENKLNSSMPQTTNYHSISNCWYYLVVLICSTTVPTSNLINHISLSIPLLRTTPYQPHWV